MAWALETGFPRRWPWETRIRFFAQTGVARGLIKFHIDKVFKHDPEARARYNRVAKAAEKTTCFCGRPETRDVLLKKAAHDARFAHRGPGATPRIELSEGLFSRLRGA